MAFAWKDNIVEFDSNICRLCAGICDSLLPIFDMNDSVKNRVDIKIKKCFPSLLENKGTVVETCVIKQTPSCLWPTDGSKNEKTLTVHDGGVIVLSKMGSDMLDAQHQSDDNRDFVVMVELKYKEPDSLSDERTIITSSESQIDAYDMREKLESLVTFPEETSADDHGVNKNKDCDNAYSGSDMKHNSDISASQLMCFEHSDTETSKEKCIQLITNKSDSIKKSNFDKNNEQFKKRIGVKCSTGKKLFVCSVCSKQFQRRTRLNSHMAIHTEIRPHSCDLCHESFVMRWDLTLHQRIHSRTFECEYCKKIFTVRSKLDRHLRTHTGERPHVCGYCCKSFGDKRNLDNHLRTHTGEKPYLCNICNRGFRVRTHLTDHQRVHTREMPYSCDTCGKTFRWKANFNIHMKMHLPVK
ncbi:uncharacterized protein LOC142331596 isoform X2 [Lycorma delicatula]|uniref:uncharacterized protein LOC142331596 isoform X2 n=1 Tax=Lycorma delicatula TaxID=130591 RepID=UPI003F5147E9